MKSGVLHRYVKPANILIRAEDGATLTADFGLASLAGCTTISRLGHDLGTLTYLPPGALPGRCSPRGLVRNRRSG
jgi:eukaryotic-like serine/threonine-protein kinase